MIRTFFHFPFGLWGFCEFPSTTGTNTMFGKIRSGGDLLVWVGRLEIVLGRERRDRKRSRTAHVHNLGDQNLGTWHWDLFSPHR